MAETSKKVEAVSIDAEALANALRTHVKEIAHEINESLGRQLAALKEDVTATACQVAALRERQERIEQHGRPAAGEEWYEKAPEGDREHLRRIDRELRELERVLSGPQSLLERGDGDSRTPVTENATWALPAYEPVGPDARFKNTGGY